MKIGIIGAGKIGYAILKIVNADQKIASAKSKDSLKKISKIAKQTKDNNEVIKESDIVFLCVKPYQIKDLLEEIKESVSNQILISIAAGISLNTMLSIIPNAKLIRLMPNTPCLVGEMAAAYTISKNITDIEEKKIHNFLNSIGISIKVDESDIDNVTALSGSGPAFLALIVKYQIEAAIEEGLDKETAYKLATKTMKGTAKLLESMTPDKVIEMVKSPKGTTEAGLNVLEDNNIKKIIQDTIHAAKIRSKELGK